MRLRDRLRRVSRDPVHGTVIQRPYRATRYDGDYTKDPLEKFLTFLHEQWNRRHTLYCAGIPGSGVAGPQGTLMEIDEAEREAAGDLSMLMYRIEEDRGWYWSGKEQRMVTDTYRSRSLSSEDSHSTEAGE